MYSWANYLILYCTETKFFVTDLTWGPVTSMLYHSRLCITTRMAECYWSEESSPRFVGITIEIHIIYRKSSGQAILFNIWTIWAMDRTSAQPQVNLSLLRSNSLKFQPLEVHRSLYCWVSGPILLRMCLYMDAELPVFVVQPYWMQEKS